MPLYVKIESSGESMGWRHELGCVSIQVIVNTTELGEIHKRVSMDREGDSGQNLEHSSIKRTGEQKNKQRKPGRSN